MALTVYSTQNCTQCKATYAYLDKLGVEYTSVDINEDPKGAEVLNKYSFQVAPIVVATDASGAEDAWCGFRVDKLKAYALENASAASVA